MYTQSLFAAVFGLLLVNKQEKHNEDNESNQNFKFNFDNIKK